MNVHGILAKHCLHCILCNSSMSRAIFCAFVLPRIARMQLTSRVEIALPQILEWGTKCRRRTLASTPPHTKLTANECDICCRFLCRRQLRQGIRKGIGLSFLLCFKLFNCNDCILHIGSPHIALSTISQPANPSIYHFNMNMSQCSPLGVR